MHIKPERLGAHLEKHGLQPCYLLFGDEPLQLLEAADAVRARAVAAGETERIVHEIDAHFDWQELAAARGSLSLFAARRLIEIRCGAREPDKTARDAILALVAGIEPGDTVLVTADGLGKREKRDAWVAAFERAGAVVVQVYPLKLPAIERWLVARAARHGRTLAPEAAELIATRVEGNLLAAAQEIEKLCLIIDTDRLSLEQVMVAVTDSSRYDLFGLVDAALEGAAARAVRMLRGLRAEGTEAVLVCWAFNRELRLLARIAADVGRDRSWDAACEQHRVPRFRVASLRPVLARHDARQLAALLRRSARIDQMIKGQAIGDPWDELEQLALGLAGLDVLPVPRVRGLA